MIRALVVDDEIPARRELAFMLESSGKVRVIGECEDGEDVLPFIMETTVDVVFLDIQMRVQSGLYTAWQIMQSKNPPRIIFTTGFSQYAQEAFELNAIDYIMKPYVQERVNRSVVKLKESLRAEAFNAPIAAMIERGGTFEPNRLLAWKNDRLIVIPHADILLAKSDESRKTVIATSKGFFYVNYTLKELEERLRPPTFLRTHKAFIANLDRVQEITPWFNNTYMLKIEGAEEHEVPVARHYMKQFQRFMGIAQ
jgi:DNA-binding LytR/AlgR family response regulator